MTRRRLGGYPSAAEPVRLLPVVPAGPAPGALPTEPDWSIVVCKHCSRRVDDGHKHAGDRMDDLAASLRANVVLSLVVGLLGLVVLVLIDHYSHVPR